MNDRKLCIGMCGTFDVENYGDLIFPLIAEAELSRRLGKLDLQRFSYNAKTPPDWPFSTHSVTELPMLAAGLDGMIVGGGDLIRFDKMIAPGYVPPAGIHHPSGYWLTPMLIALQHGIPVIWNAPGAYGLVPEWARPLMELAIDSSSYVSVRNEDSRQALIPYAKNREIHLVPDTVFGIAALVDVRHPSTGYERLCESLGLRAPYILIQAVPELEAVPRMIRKHAHAFRDYQVMVLPIGPALGENSAIFTDDLPDAIRPDAWPEPLLLAELIAHASVVVGSSLHLAISALAFGVPVIRPAANAFGGKFGILVGLDKVFTFEAADELDPAWFLSKITRGELSPAIPEMRKLLSDHWDRIAAILSTGDGEIKGSANLGRFWQGIPNNLENEAAAVKELNSLRAENERLTAERDALHASRSWRSTAPLRALSDVIRGKPGSPRAQSAGPRIINVACIKQQSLSSDPYEWGFVNGLYSATDAEALASTYPRDHFKTVEGNDGEKTYEYEARSLIHMGAARPTHPEKLSAAWQRFAYDLLSPAYRESMTQMTGRDLSKAQIEANLFHYTPGSWLGPHLDLKTKIVTHVFYFNKSWDLADGGCLTILRSSNISDAVTQILPIVGNSSVLIRSEKSWHAVSRVVDSCTRSRRSVTVTFYYPGSPSTMWLPGDTSPLHDFNMQGDY